MASAEGGAHSKGWSKAFSKKVFRTKEKVLQNLGKADKTTDDQFDVFVGNFSKQQNAANKLQKELKNYMNCVKNMSAASKNFYETMGEVYENEWTGYAEMQSAIQQLQVLWEAYLQDLADRIQIPLTTYIHRFPDARAKMNKRGRKLVDYDSARHNYDAQVSAKKQDEVKLTKTTEELAEAKKIYEVINNELHEEIPSLYESRVGFIASNFHNLFEAEAKFQEESAKLKIQMANAAEKLAETAPLTHGMYTTKTITSINMSVSGEPSPLPDSSEHHQGLAAIYNVPVANDTTSQQSSRSTHGSNSPAGSLRTSQAEEPEPPAVQEMARSASHPPPPQQEAPKPTTNGETESGAESVEFSPRKETPPPAKPLDSPTQDAYEPVNMGAQLTDWEPGESTDDVDISAPVPKAVTPPPTKDGVDGEQEKSVYAEAGDTSDIYTIPKSNQPICKTEEGIEFLYKVEATHAYAGEDFDELTFDMGDMILVLPFEDPDDQDDGWLCGVLRRTNQKGVFPANFTKQV